MGHSALAVLQSPLRAPCILQQLCYSAYAPTEVRCIPTASDIWQPHRHRKCANLVETPLSPFRSRAEARSTATGRSGGRAQSPGRSRSSDPGAQTHGHGTSTVAVVVLPAFVEPSPIKLAVRPPTVHSLCVFPNSTNDWLGILSIAQFRTMHVPNDIRFKYTKVVAPAG